MKTKIRKIITLILLTLFLICSIGCASHVHNYKTSLVKPTCTERGYLLHECSCGKNYESDYIVATGHQFTNYVYDNNATYEGNGTKTAVCSAVSCFERHTIVAEGTKLLNEYKVTLYYNNGNPSGQETVKEGETLPQPQPPSKENYIFTGWYTSENLKTRYDFSKPLTQDAEIYAGYELDAVNLTNTITAETMKSIVTVYSVYETPNSKGASQGSGFCFKKADNYFLLLTNCHVIRKEDITKQELSVKDYKGNVYEAEIVNDAVLPEYDLACLRVYIEEDDDKCQVEQLSFATENPKIKEDVISLGTPKGQTNSIMYGDIVKYDKISVSNASTYLSNVTFDVICHKTDINSGSSGGPLLDVNLNVIGVNYAKSGIYAYAVPVEKVIEFLKLYNLY